jgi:hypothetical protein
MGWIGSTNLCWLQLLDRAQQMLALVSVSIDQFVEVDQTSCGGGGGGGSGAGGEVETVAAYTTLLEERTPLHVTP